LKVENKISYKLDKTNVVPRDVYSCNVLAHTSSINFLFYQSKKRLFFHTIGNGTALQSRDCLPIEMHVDKYKLFYVRKNIKGAFEIIFINLGYWTVPDNVMATDSSEIIATACITDANEARIVALNKQREIKIYQGTSMIKRFHTNFSLENFDHGMPLSFP